MSAPTEVERPDNSVDESSPTETTIWALMAVASGLVAAFGHYTNTAFTTFIATMCASICFAFAVFTIVDL